jgi:hypothetical protein
MAFTHKNKVLRTKIGCLDRNLIPADCDMFIRRGFFKLIFEVEATNGSQEVNMLDANNGNGGNDDAHNGGHNNEEGTDMEMDPKGIDEGATSNTDGQGDTYENNGMDGMQLQAQQLQEIKVGSINVDLSPTSTLASPQILVQKQFFQSLYLMLNF